MPLIKSASKKAVGKNIKTEEEHGKPHKQAVAIALETQRRAGGGKEQLHEGSSEEEIHEVHTSGTEPEEMEEVAESHMKKKKKHETTDFEGKHHKINMA